MSTSHLLPLIAKLGIAEDIAVELLEGHKPYPDAVHEEKPFPANTVVYGTRALPAGVVVGKSEQANTVVMVIVAESVEMLRALDLWSLAWSPQYKPFVDRRDGKVMAASLEVGRGIVFKNELGDWMVARVLEFLIWGAYDDPVSKGRWERWAWIHDPARLHMPIFEMVDGY